MKFRYEYRTSDNAPHSEVIVARNREAVFSLLAKRHIKPSRVEALPDPWRWLRLSAYVAVVAAILVGASWWAGYRRTLVEPESRRQIYGDPVLIENGIARDWADVFADSLNRYLARYAQPGWKIRVRDDEAQRKLIADRLVTDAKCRLRYSDDDLMEYRQLRRIVAGIRREAVEFMEAGGSAEEYLRLLDVRQQQEHDIQTQTLEKFRAAIDQVPKDRVYEIWVGCNRRLKSMGLKPIPAPESLGEL